MNLPAIAERDMPKPGYPVPTTGAYAQCSSNATLMMLTMAALSDAFPTRQIDVVDVIDAVKKVCAGLKTADEQEIVVKYVEHLKRPTVDNGLAIPIGLAVGYYAAAADIGLDVLRVISNAASAAFGLPTSQSRTALAIAMLSWSLAESGYFCSEDLEMLVEFDLLSEDAALVVYILFEPLALDNKFFDKFPTVTEQPLIYNLPHSEQALVRTLFYLLRISTQYKEDEIYFSTVPKENLNEVFDDIDLGTDVGFLFGSLVTLSEQTGENGCYKLLIPENLVTESPYAEQVHRIFKDIKGV